MGPFVPDIITDELNLIVALLLGIGMGVIFEQAGFSSSKRLAGVFYGYDFTVLRVFFTAGVTAMIGVLLLGAFGLLDTDAIYVNPTFLGPAILGGIIMGFGFILGGYCPGTSLSAAAIGKKDGIAFVIGGLLGVFVFGELFPLYDKFYISGDWGAVKISDSLGVSQGVFVFMMTAMAVAAFYFTTRIEKKVNPASSVLSFPVKRHMAAAALALALAALAIVLPNRKAALMAEASDPTYQQAHPVKTMSADELTFRILDNEPGLVIVDVRNAEDFQKMTLPGAVNIPPEQLLGKQWSSFLGMRHKHRVFIDNDGTTARSAALLAMRLGYTNVAMLDGGMNALRSTILEFHQPGEPPVRSEEATYRFRARASVMLPKMIEESKNQQPKVQTTTKKIAGGC
jgi:rhodanese-related sulfurtransferase